MGALLVGLAVAVPASAAPGDPLYLSVTKSVSNPTPAAGEPFTYTVRVSCSEQSCLDAELTDAFPAELAGFDLLGVDFNPSESTVPRTVVWDVDGVQSATAPSTISADTTLHVDFTGAVSAPVGTGLQYGRTFTALLTLQAPATLPPGTLVAVNTASTTATNSAPDDDQATVTVTVDRELGVDARKTWTPATRAFVAGAPSTISLAGTNASNVDVQSLAIQEPSIAPDGAASLDASNPFTIADLAGLSSIATPSGATGVTVDAYTFDGASWNWVEGLPIALPATLTLPAGVSAGDVGGLRITYEGALIEHDAEARLDVALTQRATQRDTGVDLSLTSHSVVNEVTATVDADGLDPASDTATATHTITPPGLAVSATKSFSPGRIGAGDVTTMRVTTTNQSDVGVRDLSLSDHDFFTEDIEFTGFTTFTWPQGATDATVTYQLRAGGTASENLVAPAAPAGPAAEISGFDVVFTAQTGVISAGASAVIEAGIDTSEAVTLNDVTVTVPNTVDVEAVATNGRDAQNSATANLTMVRPGIDATLAKSVRPSSSVAVGDQVVVELESRVTTTSDYVTLQSIVVEDAWSGDATFWDAFTLDELAPTEVPGATELQVQMRDAAGVWHDVAVFGPQASAFLASLSAAEIDAALAPSMSHEDVVGVRLTFASAAFPDDITVTPYLIATARGTLRSGGPVATSDSQAVTYPNTATASGNGETPEGTPITDTDGDTDNSGVVTNPGDSVSIDKYWPAATVVAQSGGVSSTNLDWSVDPGALSVAIEDMGDGSALDESVYDAFDLRRIAPIAANATAYTNGWYLLYDSVSSIELYNGATWVEVPEPASGWINASGRFVGYDLTASQRATTQGVRLTLEENTAAREAARTLDAYDPYAPAPGSGVATSPSDRRFVLDWTLRDTTRSTGEWVTDQSILNTPDPGVVNNVVTLTATTADDVLVDTAQDTIVIVNPGLGVVVTKLVNPTAPIYVPGPGTAQADMPTARFTVAVRNNSMAPASYMRVMDSPACADTDSILDCESEGTAAAAVADPFPAGIDWLTREGGNNPFDRFSLTGVQFTATNASSVSFDDSIVWLLRYNGGTYDTEQTTASAVAAMSAAELDDVVGLSVTFQGADPETTGGTFGYGATFTMDLDVQLRTHLRSSGAVQDVVANDRVSVPNSAFGQSYDPVLNDGEVDGDRDTATAVLTGGDINVGATKAMSPVLITEPTRANPVTVTLGANQGSNPASTLAPAEVRLTDDVATSPEFWDRFDFTGLGAISAPAGADHVEVETYGPFGPGGALAWVGSGAQPLAAPVVPVAAGQYGEVQGLRFVFSRADGGFFSDAVPAPAWTARVDFTAVLRDVHRGDGESVELSGTVPNTVEVISDRLNGERSVVRTAAASVGLSLGTFELEVDKLANNGVHAASAGESVPWDLTFTNAGTGYLTVDELRDEIPTYLLYTGAQAPDYTADPAGLLPEPSSVTMSGGDLVFTWPADDRTMAPGETFSVRLWMELQPGLTAGQRATNTMVVTTAEALDRCGPVNSGEQVTDDWANDPETCGAEDYVTPTVGPNLFTVKGVRGAVDGATNPSDPQTVCDATLSATGGDYYRAPCAANSVVGGVDSWVLRTQNAGTTGVSELQIFDALPAPNDVFLISGGARGSDYRPQMLDDLDVTLPGGATYSVETTASVNACAGTWADLENHEPCAQNGEVWAPASAGTDWASVTALRVTVDFGATQSGMLLPGEYVDLTFSTRNVPASAVNPDGAPVAVPASDGFAWNQFGVKYLDEGAQDFRKISPAHVGVHLLTGAIEVHKEFTGSGAALAPGTIRANPVCTVAGVAIPMGSFATLNLTSANGYVARVDGIPVGAECIVSEEGEVGAFFEVSRPADDVPVTVSQAIAAQEAVPADQVATLVNEYLPVLAFTGVDHLGSRVASAALLLLAGAALIVWSRRRKA